MRSAILLRLLLPLIAVGPDPVLGPAEPWVEPGRFVAGVTHPYFPLVQGSTLVYEGVRDGEAERTEVSVARARKTTLGVSCVFVISLSQRDDVLTASNLAWYAQDRRGNVWQFGEVVHEVRDGGIAGVRRVWEGGVGGAMPAVVMPAALPSVGDTVVHRFTPEGPETVRVILAVDETTQTQAVELQGCLRVRDYHPLRGAEVVERVYAPGLGLVRTIDRDGPGSSRLVGILVSVPGGGMSSLPSPLPPRTTGGPGAQGAPPVAGAVPGAAPLPESVAVRALDRGAALGAMLEMTLAEGQRFRTIRIVDRSRMLGITIDLPAPGESGEGQVSVEPLD